MPEIYDNIRALVEKTFDTGWADTTPVKYPNVKWQQPTGATAEWAELNITWGDAEQLDMGTTKKMRQHGLVVCVLNIPVGTGVKRAYQLANKFAAYFRFKALTQETTVLNGYESNVGNAHQGQTHYSLMATVRFHADDDFD